MEEIKFSAEVRSADKKAKHLLADGVLPCILYGQKEEALSIQCNATEFGKVYAKAGSNTIIDLQVGKNNEKVLVHEIQRDPVSSQIIHVDFYRLDLTQEITAKIPLEVTGTSESIKEQSGVLVVSFSELEVKCLPTKLPHKIEVDITGKMDKVGDSLHLKDIVLPEGVRFAEDPEVTIATITAARMQEAAAASAAETAAAAAATAAAAAAGGEAAAEGAAPAEGEAAAPAAEGKDAKATPAEKK